MTVERIYKSREQMIEGLKPIGFGDLKEAENTLQDSYVVIEEAVVDLLNAQDDYFTALDEYSDTPSEEMEAGVQITALALDNAWAETQKALSSYAVLAGIDGNEAFQRNLG